jgi:hypothetical protein
MIRKKRNFDFPTRAWSRTRCARGGRVRSRRLVVIIESVTSLVRARTLLLLLLWSLCIWIPTRYNIRDTSFYCAGKSIKPRESVWLPSGMLFPHTPLPAYTNAINKVVSFVAKVSRTMYNGGNKTMRPKPSALNLIIILL